MSVNKPFGVLDFSQRRREPEIKALTVVFNCVLNGSLEYLVFLESQGPGKGTS